MEWPASVVVPAHDEEQVIGRCLASLVAPADQAALQIVVVANGCADRTAAEARRYADRLPGLQVLELAEPGKSRALNVGDGVATAFPRIFLDADIELAPGAVAGLIAALDVTQPVVAAPLVRFDTSGASLLVRSFYRIFSVLPYVDHGMVGLGVYGVSAAGRARFRRFPDIHGDDLFVQRLFTEAERVTSPGEFLVRTPRTLRSLVDVRTRVAVGNTRLTAEEAPGLDVAPTTQRTLWALAQAVLSRPARWFDALVYVGVTVVARARSRKAHSDVWFRDQSSRS